MRYLNKIVLINSAHIRYAEVMLDGNVHFIGTQGVGKSTLLRAILFFYNADKMKLGIQKEQKGFDDFYLPSIDSYIVYEVVRENGKFCVVVFRNQGRAVFRFIDCAYDRRFFIDDTGHVYYEWSKIRQQVGKHFISNIIRYYDAYRDIIYGNRQETDNELHRFSIMESNKYQNVPRTIQNIFLNQSLESRVIKDIIINSLDFSDYSIDLDFYRDKVKDFKQQYDDIWKWYSKDKNGRVKMRDDADRVNQSFKRYRGASSMVDELSGALRYALNRDEQLLPLKKDKRTTLQANLERQLRLKKEEEGKFNTERDALNGKLAVVKSKLDAIKSKRQHYADIHIDRIVSSIADEPRVVSQRQSLEKQINIITDKNHSVKEKYDELRRQENQRLAEGLNQADAAKNHIKEEENRQIADELQRDKRLRDERAALYSQQRRQVQEKLNVANNDRNEARLQELKVRQMNPYQKEREEQERKLTKLSQLEAKLKLDVQRISGQMAQLQAKARQERSDRESQYQLQCKDLQNELQTQQAASAELQQLLDRQKGSFMEWLANNVEGWEHTFGRVMDEKDVLYNTDLEPRLSHNDDSVFGVDLNLDNIDHEVRKPEDIRKEKEATDRQAADIKAKINKEREQMEADIQQIEGRINKQLQQLRKEKVDRDTQLLVIPNKREKAKQQIAALDAQRDDWRAKELQAIGAKLERAQSDIVKWEAELKRIDAEEQKDHDKLTAQLKANRKKIQQAAQEQVAAQEQRKRELKADHDRQMKLLDRQMDAELKGTGVDTSQLELLRQQLADVVRQWQFIENHRADYYAYMKDKEELFDHEAEWIGQRQLTAKRIADLTDKYQTRALRLNNAIQELTTQVRQLDTLIDGMQQAIAEVKSFLEGDSCPPQVLQAEPTETAKPLAAIDKELRDQITSKMRYLESFKEAVSIFRKNFSPQNTFHFRTDFNTEADYTDFAINLYEFTSSLKIEEYRQRTSRVYVSILQRISREVNEMLSHKSTIEGTIHDINRDFVNNNFVGVVKSIELRSVASNDPLMQLLESITRFVDDAGNNLGELNLFSDANAVAAANRKAIGLLMNLMDHLEIESKRNQLTLADTFKLEFRVVENDNDTGFVEKLSNVGSDGTDILVKAMVNIMLLNVFKQKVSRRFGDFRLHCLMDEIGKLHPNNVRGILDFANKRNIDLINSSPTTYSAEAYRYTYALSKDSKSNTVVKTLLAIHDNPSA
jgi:hypothetical protein